MTLANTCFCIANIALTAVVFRWGLKACLTTTCWLGDSQSVPGSPCRLCLSWDWKMKSLGCQSQLLPQRLTFLSL